MISPKKYSLEEIDDYLEIIANSLLLGDIMIYPTETVAGIGSISLQESLNRIFDAKGRDQKKPVSYAFSNVSMLREYVFIDPRYHKFLDLFPGPITLILPLKEGVTLHGLTGSTVGVRIPDVPWFLNLIEMVQQPIVTTSANISGQPAPVNTSKLPNKLLQSVDILIEWQNDLHGVPSTIVSLVNKPEILRLGSISEQIINEIIQSLD
ncbi:MAG: threonylcarbamoyl-AMP synthase [Candidatus Heimdallarchaeota archaeon]|nr:threonylcarbamoyl-AMP synthase [Candidatus Heimdallarchaeota archaeon]